jgi:hypothetical protein
MKPQWKHLEDRVHELLGEDVAVEHSKHWHSVNFEVPNLEISRLAPLLPEINTLYVFPRTDLKDRVWLEVFISPKRRSD